MRAVKRTNTLSSSGKSQALKKSRLSAAIASALGKAWLIISQASELKRFERFSFRETPATGTLPAENRPFGILAPRERN
jgi:hypothetical protein